MFKALRYSKVIQLIIYLIDILLVSLYIVFTINKEIKNTDFIYSLLCLVVVLPLTANVIISFILDKSTKKYYIKIANTIGGDVSEAYKFGGIGIVIFDDEQTVVWSSGLFEDRNINLLGEKIGNRFPGLLSLINEKDDADKEQVTTVFLNKRIYSTILVKELNLFIFKDITDADLLKKKYINEQPIVGYLLIDDNDSLQSVLGEDKYFEVNRDIISCINEWCNNTGFVSSKVKEDIFLLIGTEDNYQTAKKNNYELLSKISNIAKDETKITVSIGFGRGLCDYKKLMELARESLNIAESRGGNQVVTNNYEKNIDFFGVQSAERKGRTNSAKLRIVGKAISSHISSADSIYLIPHIEADFDAIGACLGIYQYCQHFGKDVHIVADDKQIELKARIMFNDLFDDDILISPSKAINEVDENSLIFVCDVSRPELLTAPKVVEKARNVIIIDHHRESENTLDNPTFVLRDLEASSTSEIVSLLLEEMSEHSIESSFATFLLAGIILDTNNLSVKTTPLTFKACMYLQENYADIKLAKSYMKDEFEEYEIKTKTLSSMESPLYGYVVATCPDDEILEKATLAKICNEAIDIKGVSVAFVIGYIGKKEVGVSARSDGTTNVSLFMEKLGGGGHHSASAAQISDSTIEEVKNKLKGIIKLYSSEA